jgi:hypothetical protein
MAELLVYNTIHWWDNLTKEDKEKHDKHTQLKMVGRYKIGDVVEVRPDGYFTGPEAKGYRHDVFRLVIKPGDAELYKDLLDDDMFIEDNKEYHIRRTRKVELNDSIIVKDPAEWNDEKDDIIGSIAIG